MLVFYRALVKILEHPVRKGIVPDAVEEQDCIDPADVIVHNPETPCSNNTVEHDELAWDKVHQLARAWVRGQSRITRRVHPVA